MKSYKNVIKVGTKRKLKRDCINNLSGSIGVCYEVYSFGEGHEGYSFIFPNGSHDGFGVDNSRDEIDMFFSDETIGVEPSVIDYNFTNVIKLSKDFSEGIFDKVWESKNE